MTEATQPKVAYRLMTGGYACLLVVVLTHVAERFSILPSMGWGLPDSPGHYLDLLSALTGIGLLLCGLAVRVRGAWKGASGRAPDPR